MAANVGRIEQTKLATVNVPGQNFSNPRVLDKIEEGSVLILGYTRTPKQHNVVKANSNL